MGLIGLILGILSAIGLMIAFIPLLGWLNWINIPFAILGLIFSVIGKSKPGMILCIAAIIFGIIRLSIGGGFI